MGYDVSISHSSHDEPVAQAVRAVLEKHGLECRILPCSPPPGKSGAESDDDGIAQSRLMVLLLSGGDDDSPRVRRDVERAALGGIPIAAFRIEDLRSPEDPGHAAPVPHRMDALNPPLGAYMAQLGVQVRLMLAPPADDAGVHPAAPVLPIKPVSVETKPPAPVRPVAAPAMPRTARRKAVIAAAMVVIALAPFAIWETYLWRRDVSARASVKPLQAAFTNSIGMQFALIPAGEFQMGSPATEAGRAANETQHAVRVTQPYMLSIHKVTRTQFAVFVKAAAYETDADRQTWAYNQTASGVKQVAGATWAWPDIMQSEKDPVVSVSWNDATVFCEWLSRTEGRTYRLPTEAEWEYACRAGAKTAWPWGADTGGGKGWCNIADKSLKLKFPKADTVTWSDGYLFTSPVGSFKPNPYGLYDMIGNAQEWCSDWYAPFTADPAEDPEGPAGGDSRVARGASWFSSARNARIAIRSPHPPDYRISLIGFRVATEAK